MTRTRDGRTGFTLTELLVAMSVVIVLGAIGAAVVPGAVSQDRTTDGAALVRQYLMISKNRAARDGLPRGLRFIVTADPTVPTKNPLWVTELQEIEAPEVVVPNIIQTTTSNLNTPPATGITNPSPCVQVLYTLGDGVTAPAGQIINRQIFLRNLTTDQATAVQQGALLGIPEFNGYWARIFSYDSSTGEVRLINQTITGVQAGNTTPTTYPDEYMGASTNALSYRFGVYAPPQPLIAAPVLPLPRNICVDLNVSNPTWSSTGLVPYDVLFAPNGQVINGLGRPVVDGQMFLWVRDFTKVPNPLVVTGTVPGPPVQNIYDVNVFRTAGEQQIVSLKAKTGALGVFPVLWPNEATGVYVVGQDPYSFARQGATGP